MWGEPLGGRAEYLRFLSGFRRAQQVRQELVSELRNAVWTTSALVQQPRGLRLAAPTGAVDVVHLLWLQYFDVDLRDR